MQTTILHRNGSNLYTTDVADDDTRPMRTAVERALRAGVSLAYANLAGANLTRADLTGADLTYANLTGAYLAGADLTAIREDVREILSAAPNEVKGLLEALQAGKVNGSAYEGECACLIGTIANVRGCSYKNVGIIPDSSRPAERWFLGISKGHTPENNPIAQITEEWIVEWMTENV